jgi:hypothetical protein
MPCALTCAANQVCVNVGVDMVATCKATATYVYNIKTEDLKDRLNLIVDFYAELIMRAFERPVLAKYIGLKRAILQGLKATVEKTAVGVKVTVTAPVFSADSTTSAGAGRRLLAGTATDQVMTEQNNENPYQSTQETGTTGSAAQVGVLFSMAVASFAAALF